MLLLLLKLAQFIDGISGPTFVGPPLREEIQQQCQYILAFDRYCIKINFINMTLVLFSSGFAGSQPVSMDVQNISLLQEKPYRVSWKADGTRCSVILIIIIACSDESST